MAENENQGQAWNRDKWPGLPDGCEEIGPGTAKSILAMQRELTAARGLIEHAARGYVGNPTLAEMAQEYQRTFGGGPLNVRDELRRRYGDNALAWPPEIIAMLFSAPDWKTVGEVQAEARQWLLDNPAPSQPEPNVHGLMLDWRDFNEIALRRPAQDVKQQSHDARLTEAIHKTHIELLGISGTGKVDRVTATILSGLADRLKAVLAGQRFGE